MALSLLSIHDPTMYNIKPTSVSSSSSVSPLASDTTTRLDLSRRKQKNPKSLNSSGIDPDISSLDKSFEESNGDSTNSCEDPKDISELVKVEINNSSDDISEQERSPAPSSSTGQMLPPLDDFMRKSNMVPFGDVTVTNHPNTPPIPMTFPMVYLFPVSKDEISGEAKYKMLIPRTGPELPLGFPPFFPLHSPPLMPQINSRFSVGTEDIASSEPGSGGKKSNKAVVEGRERNTNGKTLKVDCTEGESSTAPLDLTHRSPTSSASDTEEEGVVRAARRESSTKQSTASSPEQKLGSDIEEHLQFLKVKQMELLKVAAESAVQANRCNDCGINFNKYQNYLAHKKYYCHGNKPPQTQDSDEEAQAQTSAQAKQPLTSPSSPPFSPSSQNLSNLPKQNIFNQEFFLNQKSLLESFPGKLPLLMTPPGLLQQPASSHFVCQGCGIKFKNVSNLKAHQSRYCSGIKGSEEAQPAPGLEALLKTQMSGSGGLGTALPMQGISAADMITFLSAQHMAASKNTEEKKSPSPPSQASRGKSPKTFTESLGASSSSSKTENEDFCCILCGFKESSVEKLKDHINMHFIGQVKKRKAEGEGEQGQDQEESQSSPQSSELAQDHQSKRVKKDVEESGSDTIVDIKQEKEKEGGMKCSNCDTSFYNLTTFRAHVNYYCKKRDTEQN